MRMYQIVEGWVRDMQTDSPPEAAAIEAVGVAAACLVLRYDSAIVGRGASFQEGAAGLREAADEAITEARRRIPGMTGQDARAREELLAPRITISLELASTLIPIAPASFDEVDLLVRPGLEGVAARWGASVDGIFPSHMMFAGQSAADASVSAISSASGDPTLALRPDPRSQPPQLAERAGVRLYKFVVSHVVQKREGQQPVFLWRGSRVIEQRELSRSSLGLFADSLAVRLAGDGEAVSPLRTTYWTLRGTPAGTPSVPDDSLRALAISAWLRRRGGELEMDRKAIEPIAGQFIRRAAQSPEQGAKGGQGSIAFDAACRAVMAHSAGEMLGDAPLAWAGYPAGGAADEALGAICSPDGDWAEWVPEAVRGYMVFALVRRAADPRLSEGAKAAWLVLARRALRAVYRESRPGMLVAHMPWIGWAELALLEPDEPVPAAIALRSVRDMVWEHQLRPEDVINDGPDLAGGVVFTASRTPAPTWHTSRVAAFMATMMGDARLTDAEEELREITRVLASLRFLRQLAADEDVVWASAAPREAMWGVRAALWDQRQTPEATAMTLLAICETLDSLDAIGTRRAESQGR
jgi:hypothetical protein